MNVLEGRPFVRLLLPAFAHKAIPKMSTVLIKWSVEFLRTFQGDRDKVAPGGFLKRGSPIAQSDADRGRESLLRKIFRT